MQPTLLDIFLSDGITKAVCWTLVHSTWEGIGAALLAGLIILSTRKQPARLRYNLLSATLMAFLLVAGGTFYYELSKPTSNLLRGAVTQQTTSNAVTVSTPTQTPTLNTPPENNYLRQTETYLNTHASTITLIWLLCMSFQLVRLAGGLYNIDRLRRDGISPGPQWDQRFAELAQSLGIRRTVTLLQSKLVKAPSAFGFLKPSILVPLGLLSRLSPDQVEAILLHELAHIRRSDYLANLLLHLTEAIFFFNPGVRWIATVIRCEREACCDDMVLAGTDNKDDYFEALVGFMQFAIDQRTGSSIPAYALQLSGGRKTDLTWRIRRMLTHENKKLHLMEKTILSLGLLALVSFGTIRATISPSAKLTTKPAVAANTPSPAVEITAPPTSASPATSSSPSATSSPSTLEAIAAVASPVSRVTSPVAAVASPVAYRELAMPAVAQYSDTVPRSAYKWITFNNFTGNTTEDKGHQIYEAEGTNSDNGDRYEIREENHAIIEFKVNGELITPENYDRYKDIIEAMIGTAGHSGTPGKPGTPGRPGTPGTPGSPGTPAGVSIHGNVVSIGSESSSQAVGPESSRGSVGPAATRGSVGHTANPPYYTTNPVTLHMIADLQNDNIIDHLNPLSINLDNKRMTVNGVRQPDNIFEQYKTKYLKSGKDYVIFSQSFDDHHSSSSESVSIDDGH